ncbi:MAG: flippase-like domain-containing protein [Chloroflexi bacterium]|nr:flippase-like domain-containing protein [Chloroflexota bacterium]
MPAALKKWRFALIGALISAVALVFFLTQVDLAQFGDALRSARFELILPVAGLILLGLAARAARWRVLLGGGLTYRRCFHILNVAYLANGILPLRLGELARAFLAARSPETGRIAQRSGRTVSHLQSVGHPHAATLPTHESGDPAASVPVLQSLSTVVVERLLDVLAVLVILGLALGFAPLPDVLRASALLMLPLTVVGFAALVILSSRREQVLAQIERLAGRLKVAQRVNVAALAGHVFDGLAPLTQSKDMVMALVWTTISWVFSVASGYVLMVAFFPQVGSIAATLLFTASASFAVAVPAVPGNLGTYEASVWVGLAAMGYGEPLATATAFAVTIHGLNLLINAILGGIGLYAERLSLGELSQGVQALNVYK